LFLSVTVLLAATSTQAHAETFCALTVNILSTSGTAVTSTWIELTDEKGSVELRTATEGPRARVCDFGFGPHTLRVGTNECLPVSISNIRLTVGSPLQLDVVLNSCPYAETMRHGCLLYLRTVDELGKPVPGAAVSLGRADPVPLTTDPYGRLQTFFSGDRHVVLTKAGLRRTEQTARCRNNEEVDTRVVMKGSDAR
jgi:hypothetical protein